MLSKTFFHFSPYNYSDVRSLLITINPDLQKTKAEYNVVALSRVLAVVLLLY